MLFRQTAQKEHNKKLIDGWDCLSKFFLKVMVTHSLKVFYFRVIMDKIPLQTFCCEAKRLLSRIESYFWLISYVSFMFFWIRYPLYMALAHCVQIHLCVSPYCMAKLYPTQNWMRHSFHENFLTNSLVLSNSVLFASGNGNLKRCKP